jgi:hypothetical protein
MQWVRSLQSGLSENDREIRALFEYFVANLGGISLHFRLRGGARSLALTLLRPNSLLTASVGHRHWVRDDYLLGRPV